MTRQQRRALDFIQKSLGERGIPPTFEEVAVGLGLKSKSNVSVLLGALEASGHIRRRPNRARSIEIVDRLEVKLLPDVDTALARYARQHHTTPAIAAAELLRQVLEAA